MQKHLKFCLLLTCFLVANLGFAEYKKPLKLEHLPRVSAIVLSPDGLKAATTTSCNESSDTRDRTAIIWDTQSGQILHKLESSTAKVSSIVFSNNGKLIATASVDGTARIWNVESGKIIHTLRDHTENLNSIEFSNDDLKVVTASSDKTAKIWEVESGKLLLTIQHPSDRSIVRIAKFSPDNLKIGTITESAYVWDAITGNMIFKQNVSPYSDYYMQAISFSPDDKIVATSDRTPYTNLWNLEKPQEILSVLKGLDPRGNGTRALAFSPDDGLLAIGCTDGTVEIWDPKSSTYIRNLSDGNQNAVLSISFSGDGSKLVTAGKALNIWDFKTGSLLETLKVPPPPDYYYFTFITIAKYGSTIAAKAQTETAALIWNLN